jgi:DNA-directed RNA polymerase subunit RPC12/RpoP
MNYYSYNNFMSTKEKKKISTGRKILEVDSADVPKLRPWYKCANCRERNYFEQNDPIKCTSCGYRVMYKERNEAPRTYLAR